MSASIRSIAAGIIGMATIVGANAGTVEAGNNLLPHRAFYELSLGDSTSKSSVAGIEGRMAFEWRADCDAWVVLQRYGMRLYGNDGGMSEINTDYSTWEAKSGKAYRFDVKKQIGGTETKIEGFANYAKSSGEAVFTSPTDDEFELPQGTMFPSGHTLALIDEALSGKKFFAAPLFDGGEIEGPVFVTAAIGKSKPSPKKSIEGLEGEYWPVRLAFFESDSDISPQYEMDAALHRNGVVSSMTLDYGSYSVRFDLSKLEVLNEPSC